VKGGLGKKYGPLPLWAWLVVLAAGGYALYRYQKSRASGAEVEEGYYPTVGGGTPPEAPTAGAGGVGSLASQIGELAQAGFVPRGSEEAKAPPPEREVEVIPEHEKAPWYEELIGELAKRALAVKKGATPKGKGKKHTQPKRKTKAKGSGPGRKPTPNTPVKHPGHTHTTTTHLNPPNHTAAAHPAHRIQQRQPSRGRR
jgi:hypothetical protein